MDNTDLYCEKIRKIIGPVPRWLTVASILLSALLLSALVAALLFLPSPSGQERLWRVFFNSLF